MAQASIELLIELVGQDKVSALLKASQENMKKLGNETKRAAAKSGAWAKVTSSLKGVNTQWSEMRSKIMLAAAALRAPMALYDQIIGRLKSGEIAGNADVIFRQMHEQADEAMAAFNKVTEGIMTETDIQQLANQMELLGATTEQQVGVLEVATKMYLATGKDMSATAERLVTAVISGRTSSLKMLGVTIDLDDATKDYAISQGKTVDELSKSDQIYARLGATVEHLNSKFDEVDFDALTMDAHKLDNKFKNLVSDMESLAAGADAASAANRTLKKSLAGINDQIHDTVMGLKDLSLLEGLDKGRRIALKTIEEIGTLTHEEALKFQETLLKTLEFTDRETKQMWNAFQGGAQRSSANMEAIVENASARLRKIYTQQVSDRKKEIAERTAMLDAQIDEENIAADAADALDARQRAKRVANAAKWAASAKAHKKELQGIDDAWILYKAEQVSAEALLEAQKTAEIGKIKEKFTADEKQFSQAMVMILKEYRAKIDAIHEDDNKKGRAAGQRLQTLRMELQGEHMAFDSQSIRDVQDRRTRAMELRFQLDNEEITAEEHRILTLIDMKRDENEQRRELEEEKLEMQRGSLAAAGAYASEIQAYGKANKDNTATALGTMSAMTVQVTKDWKGLKAGSPAAISALGNVAAAGIKDERTAAGVKSAVAFASSIMAFAKGNIPSGIAFALSGSMFAAIAGKGDSGGGKASKKAAPQIASGGGGMVGQVGGGGEFTVNVMGFVGSTAQLGSDVSQAVDEVKTSGLPASATI